jgi:hypothetical protein
MSEEGLSMSDRTAGGARDFPDTEPLSTLPMALPGDEGAYAPTEPLPLANVRSVAPPVLALAPLEITLYDLMAEIRKDNRVCPLPSRWLEFYRLLEQLSAGARLPSPPLVGSAWAATPSSAKRMCFREQVEWAAANNCMNAAHVFLKKMTEAEWHYHA